MLDANQLRQAIGVIESLDHRDIARQLRHGRFPFPVDLTPEWIAARPIAELRHVFAAVCQQCDLMPEPGRNRRGSKAGRCAFAPLRFRPYPRGWKRLWTSRRRSASTCV